MLEPPCAGNEWEPPPPLRRLLSRAMGPLRGTLVLPVGIIPESARLTRRWAE